MILFKRKEKTKLDLLEEQFKNVKIWSKKTIKEKYDKRLPGLVKTIGDILSKFPDIYFLILFEEKGEKGKERSWYSEFQGKVVINVNFDPSSSELGEKFQKAIADFRLIESGIGSVKP